MFVSIMEVYVWHCVQIPRQNWRQPVILFIFSSAFAGMLEDKVYFFLEKACGLRERDSELVSLNIVADRLLVKVNSLWSVLQMIFFSEASVLVSVCLWFSSAY